MSITRIAGCLAAAISICPQRTFLATGGVGGAAGNAEDAADNAVDADEGAKADIVTISITIAPPAPAPELASGCGFNEPVCDSRLCRTFLPALRPRVAACACGAPATAPWPRTLASLSRVLLSCSLGGGLSLLTPLVAVAVSLTLASLVLAPPCAVRDTHGKKKH